MSISQPSKVIYAVEIPETENFKAEFSYNFFVPDESLNDTGGVPTSALMKPADAVDASFIQYSRSRVPRAVNFSWSIPRMSDQGNNVTDVQIRNNSFKTTNSQNGSLISDNIDRITTEDHFSSNDFVAASFHDGEIDDKVFYLVSGSFVSHTLDQVTDPNVGHQKAAMRLQAITPKHIKPHFLFRAMGNNARSSGTRFFSKQGSRVVSDYFAKLKAVVTNVQVNGKLFHDITNRSISDPNSPFAADMQSMHKFTKKLKNTVQHSTTSAVSESDYKTFIPFIDVKVRRTAFHHDQRGAEIVGFIIDKSEKLADGSLKNFPPIIVESGHSNSTADYRIKYNSTYVYSVRTIAQFSMPAIDDDTGEIAMLKVLLSSKPSNKFYVTTTEMAAPPAPNDIDFRWNYETDKLVITWTFPPNSQRDIKKFQVFRRDDVDNPFELLKQYNFDDSVLPFPDNEDPDPLLVENIRSPYNTYVDDEFSKDNNHNLSHSFIYTLASIDAHGLTSGYCAQFAVWFNRFKNRIEKKLISHTGAPKAYPNLYLEAECFTNTIRVNGSAAANMKLYFNPEFYYLIDDQERFVNVISTKQSQGSYKINVINLDNQLSQAITIRIDDRIRASSKQMAFPSVRFGRKRSGQVRPPTGQ